MADKKEVLDYLRNQQKAAEIEAKIDGVNVWVLLGAIAVVGWQLTSVSVARLWSEYELTARILVAAVALHMLSLQLTRSDSERDELRYSRTNFSEMDAPLLMLLKGVLLFLPPVALWVIAGRSVGVIALSFFGLVFVLVSVIAILNPLFPKSQKKDRLPKPEFGLTKRADTATNLGFGALFLWALVEQIAHFAAIGDRISIDDAKPLMLLAVLFLLMLITVNRKRKNDSIAWTYELETDLVLETISPEVAIRKIENRRLGPRLQDVVDSFFDDLDQRFAEVDSKLTECVEKIGAANAVPKQYPAERAARLKGASDDVVSRIDMLVADCREFREYLAKLEQKPSSGRRAVLPPVLASLKARHEVYVKRAQTAKDKLTQLLN